MKPRSERIEDADRQQLFPVLDRLIDRWCERRALRPLGLLLPAYPMANLMTDALSDVHDALQQLETLKEDITPEEREQVIYARRVAQYILDHR